jgi:hypothetical protein
MHFPVELLDEAVKVIDAAVTDDAKGTAFRTRASTDRGPMF